MRDEIDTPSLKWMIAILAAAAAIAYLSPDQRGVVNGNDEGGRGRRADSPVEIPAAGWKDIFWRTYEQVQEDRLLAVAAGVVFYGLLALFPAITALVSCYALFADPGTISDHLATLGSFIPEGPFSIVQESGRAYRFQGRPQTRFRFWPELAARDLECQRRHEGNHRCPQCRIR